MSRNGLTAGGPDTSSSSSSSQGQKRPLDEEPVEDIVDEVASAMIPDDWALLEGRFGENKLRKMVLALAKSLVTDANVDLLSKMVTE